MANDDEKHNKEYEEHLLAALGKIAMRPHPADSLNNWKTAIEAIEQECYDDNGFIIKCGHFNFRDYPLIQHFKENFSEYENRLKFVGFPFIKTTDRVARKLEKQTTNKGVKA